MFSGLRDGSLLYILRKGNKDVAPVLRIAHVTKHSDPLTAAGTAAVSYGLPMETFVNIEAQWNDEFYKFDMLKSNDTTREYPAENTIISTSREVVIQEYENMCRTSEQVLETMPYHKSVLDAREEIMCQLNPQLAKEKEQEKKIGELENKISGMEGTLNNIHEMLSKALNTNSGTRKTNNDK